MAPKPRLSDIERVFKRSKTGKVHFKREFQFFRTRLGAGQEVWRAGLRQINHSLVIPKVGVMQFGVTIKPQTPNHESVKIANQKIREIEGAGFLLMELREIFHSGKKSVAVITRQAPNAILGQHRIELAASSAVCVRHENFFKRILRFFQNRRHRSRDFFRVIVELSRQPLHFHVIPMIEASDRGDLTRQSSATHNQNGLS